MKIIVTVFVLVFLSFQSIYAYSLDEVSNHDTSSDCWVVFEDNVYDLTNYLYQHDRYLDIREWCGKDMTQDFITKADTGRDHNPSSYALLEQYYIGEITNSIQEEANLNNNDNDSSITEETSTDEKEINSNPYNIIIPLLLSLSLYWIPYFVVKKNKPINMKNFNAFWNSILISLLVIPAFGFGILMILRYRFPNLWNINFDFMYWHVELSLVMGILAINHFIQRFSIYLSQLKKRS